MAEPTDFEKELIPAVQDLVDELGKVVTLKNVTVEDVDSLTGEVTRTTEDVSVKVTPPSPFSEELRIGEEGDVEHVTGTTFLMPAEQLPVGTVPEVDEMVEIDGQLRTMLVVDGPYYGENVGHYKVFCR